MTSRAELACTVCQAIDSFRDWIPKIGEAVVDAQELGLEEKDSAGLVRQVSGEAGLQSEGILAPPASKPSRVAQGRDPPRRLALCLGTSRRDTRAR